MSFLIKSKSGRNDVADKKKAKAKKETDKLEPPANVPIEEPMQMMLAHFSGRSPLDDLNLIEQPEPLSNETRIVAIQQEPEVADSEPPN